mmetsp:Transcript_20873/g.35566  ORF Transcript_20873/g.35566 Transcript_20873/m.35566 type:complete len:223 (-) Transcript_20873:27-695(-)
MPKSPELDEFGREIRLRDEFKSSSRSRGRTTDHSSRHRSRSPSSRHRRDRSRSPHSRRRERSPGRSRGGRDEFKDEIRRYEHDRDSARRGERSRGHERDDRHRREHSRERDSRRDSADRRHDSSTATTDTNNNNKSSNATKPTPKPVQPVEPPLPLDERSQAELEMMRAMGIPVGFDTTKQKKVEGADMSGAKIGSQRKYRQYMNRRLKAKTDINGNLVPRR